jgi:hypothetical protein
MVLGASNARFKGTAMPGPEHQCIVSEFNRSLARHARTALLGMAETERSTFDYGCLLNRDLSRPLVAQVLWSNPPGIEKDLRTLIFDDEATLKVYLVRDKPSYLRKIDYIVGDYRRDPTLAGKAAGLRTIPIKADFDADKEADRIWLAEYLDGRIRSDVLFSIVFGGLTAKDFRLFHEHNAPFGVKVAILAVVSDHGIVRRPELKERINYGTTGTIDKVLAKLTGIGLGTQLGNTTLIMPTVKGRLLLDLIRRLYFEWSQRTDWSGETALLLRALNVTKSEFPADLDPARTGKDSIADLLLHCQESERSHNTRLLDGIDPAAPKFFSDFNYSYFRNRFAGCPDSNDTMFDDPDSLFFPSKQAKSS